VLTEETRSKALLRVFVGKWYSEGISLGTNKIPSAQRARRASYRLRWTSPFK